MLGETSKAYTSTVESATVFLRGAYEHPSPSETAVLEDRPKYDNCNWSDPSDEEQEILAGPPTRTRIMAKLKRASNTAPGADGHIRTSLTSIWSAACLKSCTLQCDD